MATGKPRTSPPERRWTGIGLAVVAVLGAVLWYMWGTISGYAQAGTAYGAKNACSCRYIAGRDLDSCEEDFIPGMETVFLSEDEDEHSVTASIPLIQSTTATYREGYGCVLEAWDD